MRRRSHDIPGRRARVLPAAAVVALCSALLAGSGDRSFAGQPPAPDQLRVEVLGSRPHDVDSFTQGLEISDGVLYEGTGLAGQSFVSATDLTTGDQLTRVDLPHPLFGEGIALTRTSLWQLTWQDGIAFERDPETLEEIRTVEYAGEGWGLCHQATADRLVMSDGSSTLTFRDPVTFEETGSVEVLRAGEPVRNLNELECVDGEVYANVWLTDTILRIDPDTGVVTAEIDAAGLLTEEEALHADVLNGIAKAPEGDTFLVTGKRWPHLFEVRFVPAEAHWQSIVASFDKVWAAIYPENLRDARAWAGPGVGRLVEP